MDNLLVGPFKLFGLSRVNVVLGKNGCGKTLLLQGLEAAMPPEEFGSKRYVTPERGGFLTYEPSIEGSINTSANWIADTRRVNQFAQFKQQSVTQFRRLELAYLRAHEGVDVADFEPYISRINDLLDNIEVVRPSPNEPAFTLRSKVTGDVLMPQQISSGESELISLAIEVMMFAEETIPGRPNVLLLDEPDVHLHPDLQDRLARFIGDVAKEKNFTVLIATHSTALLSGLRPFPEAAVAFMQTGDKVLHFERIEEVHKRVLPVFGAHPLSNVFNETPILVVEGEDDVRVWQAAIRSSGGDLAIYPVHCDGLPKMNEFETAVGRIVGAVYDNGVAYSLRDGDGIEEPMADLPSVIRMRLSCRTVENLILADEVLASTGIDWPTLVSRMNAWIAANGNHEAHDAMQKFKKTGFDRMNSDVKQLRNLIVGEFIDSSKPWEVLVGRVLGTVVVDIGADAAPDSIADFVGPKVARNLLQTQ
jgi:energy-coupling factor transporter ATP-binding protein EcfA2